MNPSSSRGSSRSTSEGPAVLALARPGRRASRVLDGLGGSVGSVREAADIETLFRLLSEHDTDVLVLDGDRGELDVPSTIDLVRRCGNETAIVVLEERPSGDRAELLEGRDVFSLPYETGDDVPARTVRAIAAIAERRAEVRMAARARDEAVRRVRAQETWALTTTRRLDELLHELRTPIAVVQGYAANLLDGLEGALSSGQRASIERIKIAAELMVELAGRAKHELAQPLSSITSDLVPPPKGEGGRTQLSLGELSRDALALFQRESEVQGVALESAIEPSLPFVWADRARLLQLLVNLLANAMRFTPTGGRIELSIRSVSSPDLPAAFGSCRLTVRDTGPGVPLEDQSIIFTPGWSSQGRTGLGLAIAKDVAAEHCGELTLESVPGRGAAFHLLLPIDLRVHRTALDIHLIEDATLAGQLLIELRNRHHGPLPVKRPTDMEMLASKIVGTDATIVFAGKVEEKLSSQTLDLPSPSGDGSEAS